MRINFHFWVQFRFEKFAGFNLLLHFYEKYVCLRIESNLDDGRERWLICPTVIIGVHCRHIFLISFSIRNFSSKNWAISIYFMVCRKTQSKWYAQIDVLRTSVMLLVNVLRVREIMNRKQNQTKRNKRKHVNSWV